MLTDMLLLIMYIHICAQMLTCNNFVQIQDGNAGAFDMVLNMKKNQEPFSTCTLLALELS